MVSTYTTNKALEKPSNNSYVDNWNVPVNNDWDIIDLAFGGVYTLPLTSSNVTLTQANVQSVCILLTGALSASVTVSFPALVAGFYIVRNTTSGSYTVTLNSAYSLSSASVVAAQGVNTFIWSDGQNVYRADNIGNSFDPTSSYTFTGTETFMGSTSNIAAVLTNAAEPATVSATAATGTINFDVTTQSVLYYTANASANWTLNIRGNSSTTLNSLLSNGQSMTVAFLVQCGSTAYYNSAVTIDGVSVTPVWQGSSSAPTAGYASSLNVYTFTVLKTASATYTVLGTLTQFS